MRGDRTEQGYNWGYPVSCAAYQSTVANSGSGRYNLWGTNYNMRAYIYINTVNGLMILPFTYMKQSSRDNTAIYTFNNALKSLYLCNLDKNRTMQGY